MSKINMKSNVLVMPADIAYPGCKEFMTVTLLFDGPTGISFQLPYIHTPDDAQQVWEALGAVQTELEKFIGRNTP